MSRIALQTLWQTGLAVSLLSGAVIACSAEETEPPPGGGATGATSAMSGSSSGGTAPGTAGVSASGGTGSVTAGTTGSGTGGTGSSTAGTNSGGSAGGPAMPLCTTKATVASPLFADFESYDGMVEPSKYQWIFGGAAAGELGAHAGTYAFGDGSVEPTLAFLAGHGGNYGLTVSVTNATKWGQGFGFFLMDKDFQPACVNASAYKGISLWVRGEVPTGTFSLSVATAQATPTSGGGSCPGDSTTCKPPTASDLPVTSTWTQVDVLWADLTGGLSGASPLTADGDDITGLSFGANLVFMPESEGSMVYVPVPGDISIAVDDVSFIP